MAATAPATVPRTAVAADVSGEEAAAFLRRVERDAAARVAVLRRAAFFFAVADRVVVLVVRLVAPLAPARFLGLLLAAFARALAERFADCRVVVAFFDVRLATFPPGPLLIHGACQLRRREGFALYNARRRIHAHAPRCNSCPSSRLRNG
jgi:hypothetical protein